MAQLNANTPYIECYIRNKYIYGPDSEGLTEGYIFGVKSMINRPMHFHFQSCFGAVFWQMPISAFCQHEDFDILDENEERRLSLLQTWDCQDNDIAVTTFGFLQNRRVDVFCRDRVWRSGKYVFTIDDYEGDLNELNIGYANDQDSKCYHFLAMDDGNFAIPPNNLLRWHNPDFIVPYPMDNPPKVKIFKEMLSSEDIDRSYGNSPYFFYTHYPENEKNEKIEEKESPLKSKYMYEPIYKEENNSKGRSTDEITDDIPEYPSA